MKTVLILFSILTSCASISAMDVEHREPASIATILQPALSFKIKPTSIKDITSELTFHAKDSSEQYGCTHKNGCIQGSSGQFNIRAIAKNVSMIPKNTSFCFDPCDESSNIYDNNISLSDFIYEIHYHDTPDSCKCHFSVLIASRIKNDNSYTVKLCTDILDIKQTAPLLLQGLEHPRFCNFTTLTIQGCQKLSGTDGALNNILVVMPHLINLDLEHTNLDETIIDAEHSKLETLNLKNSNCTEIKRITMPMLRILCLDYNPLLDIDWSVIKVLPQCYKSVNRNPKNS